MSVLYRKSLTVGKLQVYAIYRVAYIFFYTGEIVIILGKLLLYARYRVAYTIYVIL